MQSWFVQLVAHGERLLSSVGDAARRSGLETQLGKPRPMQVILLRSLPADLT
jgi:hypothetical protein